MWYKWDQFRWVYVFLSNWAALCQLLQQYRTAFPSVLQVCLVFCKRPLSLFSIFLPLQFCYQSLCLEITRMVQGLQSFHSYLLNPVDIQIQACLHQEAHQGACSFLVHSSSCSNETCLNATTCELRFHLWIYFNASLTVLRQEIQGLFGR